jgi:hypothetical protein
MAPGHREGSRKGAEISLGVINRAGSYIRGATRIPEKPNNVAVKLLLVGLVLSVLLAAYCFVRWRVDQAVLKQLVQKTVPAGASPSTAMRILVDYIDTEVGRDTGDAYFLVPALSFMRPTARQIIEGTGGDCAYRARAYIVMLGLLDVEASKLAVYNESGESVHAIVRVETERGPFLVDSLFGLVHEDESGGPLPANELANLTVLAGSVNRASQQGNELASHYPLDQYPLNHLRTINWEKSALMRTIYRALAHTLGDEHTKQLPRPYLSEEPALMVMLLATFFAIACLCGISVHRLRFQRRSSTENTSF